MTLITLRISKIDDFHLSFVLLSIDPSERVNQPNYEKALESTINEIANLIRTQIKKSLENDSRLALLSAGEFLTRTVWPEELSAQILKSPAEMLYLDIDEELIHIPWECIRLDSESWLGCRFVVGRHVRMPNGKDIANQNNDKRFVIISDPDGSLPTARAEGTRLLNAIGKKGLLTLLSSRVNKSEAVEYINDCDFFHFAGHSSESGLRFYDGILTAGDIIELGIAPRFAFLNSCVSGHTANDQSRSDSLIQALLENGSLGVICTNSLIISEHAACFAERFYTDFLSGKSLGESFKFAANSKNGGNDWARYTIYGNPLLYAHSYPKKNNKNILILNLLILLLSVIVSTSFLFFKIKNDEIVLTAEEKIHQTGCNKGTLTSCYNFANSLRDRDKIDNAMEIYQTACDAGHRDSCSELAIQMLSIGDIEKATTIGEVACAGTDVSCFSYIFALIERDLDEPAARLAAQRCHRGQGLGCSLLANLYDSQGDSDKAMEFHEKSCRMSYQLGCARHALMSVSLKKDTEKLELLKTYCNNNITEGACTDYGHALLIFNKVNEAMTVFDQDCSSKSRHAAYSCELAGAAILQFNAEKSKEYFKKSCEFGRASACSRLLVELGDPIDMPCGKMNYSECRELGYRHQMNNNPEKALRIYEYLCNQGFFSACNDAGIVAKNESNLPLSEHYFRKGCLSNQKYSCENLADILDVTGRQIEALKITKEACHRGIGSACFKAHYLSGNQKEIQHTAELLEQGCELGHPASCNDYGFLMNKKSDKTKSISAYTKACTDGFIKSCLNLGSLYSELGKIPEAIMWYTHSCKAGNLNGCDLLDVTEIQQLRKLKKNVEAFKLIQKYCDNNRTDGCFDFGEIALELSEKEKAAGAFLKSCHGHDFAGCTKYGELQLAEEKIDIAIEFCSKACRGGDNSGCLCAKKASKIQNK